LKITFSSTVKRLFGFLKQFFPTISSPAIIVSHFYRAMLC